MKSINDIVRSRFCHGKPMFPGMSLSDAYTIMQTVRVLDDMQSEPFDSRRLSSGSFLQDVLANVGTVKFQLFSAHDDTLRSFLLSMHAYDYRWPPLASHVALEYWRETATGNMFVVLQFDGENQVMKPPCKDVYCDIDDFTDLINSYKIQPKDCDA